MIEGCQYLQELIFEKEAFEHNSYLGGSLLEIKTLVNREIAKVTYEYCPGLNKENLINTNVQISREEYLWQWRNIVYDLLHITQK
ncbi:MAG: hypothetical protein AB4372_36270 [Xenococcus sp. (in: cyanobacteria)]